MNNKKSDVYNKQTEDSVKGLEKIAFNNFKAWFEGVRADVTLNQTASSQVFNSIRVGDQYLVADKSGSVLGIFGDENINVTANVELGELHFQANLDGYVKNTDLAEENKVGVIAIAGQQEVELGAVVNKAITPVSLAKKLESYVTATNLNDYITKKDLKYYLESSDIATEDSYGVIAIANQNEVNFGVNVSKAVTPNKLAQKLINYVRSEELNNYITKSGISSYIVSPDLSSEQTAGLIAIATQGEVEAGVNVLKAVTPFSLLKTLNKYATSDQLLNFINKSDLSKCVLKSDNASEYNEGLISIATQAEVDRGDDVSKVVTPGKLARKLINFVTKNDLQLLNTNPGLASDKAAGSVVLASQYETEVGNSADKVVTPLTLSYKLSSYVKKDVLQKYVDISVIDDYVKKSDFAGDNIAGVIQLAGQAEVDLGVEISKAVTPARLQNKLTNYVTIDRLGDFFTKREINTVLQNINIASEVSFGTICIATQSEVDLCANVNKAVTPDKLANKLSNYVTKDQIASFIPSQPQASEYIFGSIAIASQSEIDLGVVVPKAVTPDKLAKKLCNYLSKIEAQNVLSGLNAASESEFGILAIATQLEIDQGLDVVKAITPNKLATTLGNYVTQLEAKTFVKQYTISTETVPGAICLATEDEVKFGVSVPKAITPHVLQEKLSNYITFNSLKVFFNENIASESIVGTIALATDEEVKNGSKVLKAITPDKLATQLAKYLTLDCLLEYVTKDDIKGIVEGFGSADQDVAGIIALASREEVFSGSDVLKAVTPIRLEEKLSLYAKLDDLKKFVTKSEIGTYTTLGFASEGFSGLIAIASAQETSEGANTMKAVTPFSLASELRQYVKKVSLGDYVTKVDLFNYVPTISSATENAVGLISLATLDEVNRGLQVDKAVTPNTLAEVLKKYILQSNSSDFISNDILNKSLSNYLLKSELLNYLPQIALATEECFGAVKIATLDEVLLEDSGLKVVTPKLLAAKLLAYATKNDLVNFITKNDLNSFVPDINLSSELNPGLISVATQLEIDSGAQVIKAVTPDRLAKALSHYATNDSLNVYLKKEELSHFVLNIPSASDSAMGIIALATFVEMDASTNEDKAVTPALLGYKLASYVTKDEIGQYVLKRDVNNLISNLRVASQNSTGIISLASLSEVEAGALVSKAVTPDVLFERLKSYAPLTSLNNYIDISKLEGVLNNYTVNNVSKFVSDALNGYVTNSALQNYATQSDLINSIAVSLQNYVKLSDLSVYVQSVVLNEVVTKNALKVILDDYSTVEKTNELLDVFSSTVVEDKIQKALVNRSDILINNSSSLVSIERGGTITSEVCFFVEDFSLMKLLEVSISLVNQNKDFTILKSKYLILKINGNFLVQPCNLENKIYNKGLPEILLQDVCVNISEIGVINVVYTNNLGQKIDFSQMNLVIKDI